MEGPIRRYQNKGVRCMAFKIYVGCSLTQASSDFKSFIDAFKLGLRDRGYEVLDFVGLVKGSVVDVYKLSNINSCLPQSRANRWRRCCFACRNL